MDLQTKHPHRLAMLNAPYFTNKDCISTVMRDWQTCWQQSSQFNICSRMFGVATCRLTNVCSTNEDIAIFFNDKQTSVPCGNWNECTLLKPMAPPMLKCHWSHTHTHSYSFFHQQQDLQLMKNDLHFAWACSLHCHARTSAECQGGDSEITHECG